MKKQLFLILVLPMVMFVSSCSQSNEKKSDKISFSSAIEYNDYIVNLQTKTIKEILALTDQLKNGDSLAIQQSFNKFGTQAKKSLEDLKKLDSFKGDVSFRNSALDLFQFYVTIYEVDYKEMINIVTKKNVTDKDLARVDQIVAKVSTDEVKFDDNFAKAQQAFAEKNNMKIIKNELQDEIDNK